MGCDIMAIGTCYLVTNTNLINSQQARVVTITDTKDYMNIPNSVGASILMPPYQAMMALLDNEERIFRQIYSEYLCLPEVDQMLTIITKAVYNGVNIILFIPSDEVDIWVELLLYHINQKFGIIVGTKNSPFMIDNSKFINLQISCFMYDIIGLEEIMKSIPKDNYLINIITPKVMAYYNKPLTNDSHIFVSNIWDMIHLNKKELQVIKPIKGDNI